MAKSRSAKKDRPVEQAPAKSNVAVRLETIEVQGFAVFELPDFPAAPLTFDFDNAVSMRIERDTMLMRVQVAIGGAPNFGGGPRKEITEDDILFTIAVRFTFQITGTFAYSESGDPHVPDWLLATVVSTSVGTTRGILFEKLSATPYQKFPLPIATLTDLMPGGPRSTLPGHGI